MLAAASTATTHRNLRILGNRLRRGVVYLQSRAHFLQLRCLLVYHRGQSLHFRSQLCNCGFLLVNLAILLLASAVLFEKLIQQHRVDGFVADRFWFAGLVASDEGGLISATSSAIKPKEEETKNLAGKVLRLIQIR